MESMWVKKETDRERDRDREREVSYYGLDIHGLYI